MPRKKRAKLSAKEEDDGTVAPKYYKQRYRLFSRYDEGVQLDAESWYSATPEIVARHIAQRVLHALPGPRLILDPFCGAGGNAIQFVAAANAAARHQQLLCVCVDIDPHKAALTAHNAAVYGVRDRLEIVVGDFMLLASRLRGDAVFLSPPWGGPENVRQHNGDDSAATVVPFSLHSMKPDGVEVFKKAQAISSAVAYYLPRHTDARELAMLDVECEVEINSIQDRPRTITAFFGPLQLKSPSTTTTSTMTTTTSSGSTACQSLDNS